MENQLEPIVIEQEVIITGIDIPFLALVDIIFQFYMASLAVGLVFAIIGWILYAIGWILYAVFS
jgi:hypothetical protein